MKINLLYIVSVFCLLVSCSKNNDLDDSEIVKVKIDVTGLENTDVSLEAMNYNAASISKTASQNTVMKEEVDNGNVIYGAMDESHFIPNSKIVIHNKLNAEKEKNAAVVVNKMNTGVHYRVLVYKKVGANVDFSTPVASQNLVSGTSGEITLYRNTNYVYVAYSYNLKTPFNESLEPLSATSLEFVNGRDLLYATGNINISSQGNTPLNILFKRQLSAYVIQIDARGVFADELLSVDATVSSTESTRIFYKGTFSILTGQFTDTAPYNPEIKPVANVDFGYDIDKDYSDVKRYYIFSARPILGRRGANQVGQIAIGINSFKYRRDNDIYEFKSTSSTPYTTVNLTIPTSINEVAIGNVYGAYVIFIEPGLRAASSTMSPNLPWAVGNVYDRGPSFDETRRYIFSKHTEVNNTDDGSYFSTSPSANKNSFLDAFVSRSASEWVIKSTPNINCNNVYPRNAWTSPSTNQLLNILGSVDDRVDDGTKTYWEYTIAPKSRLDVSSPFHVNYTHLPGYIAKHVTLRFGKNGGKRKIYPKFDSQYTSPTGYVAMNSDVGYYGASQNNGYGNNILEMTTAAVANSVQARLANVPNGTAFADQYTYDNFSNLRCLRSINSSFVY